MIEYKYAITLTTKKKAIFQDVLTSWKNAVIFMEHNFGERVFNWTIEIEKHPSKDWFHFHGKTTFYRWRSNNATSDIYLHIKRIKNEEGWDKYTTKTKSLEFLEEPAPDLEL